MSDYSLLKLVASLAFILGLILTLAWLARRKGWTKHARSQPISLVGSYRIGPRHTIAVVEVSDARLVLGIAPQNVSLLHILQSDGNTHHAPIKSEPLVEKFGATLNKAMETR